MSEKDLQGEINKEVHTDIIRLYDHAHTANEEMGAIKVSIKAVETDVGWIKNALEKVDTRSWWILSAVVLGGVAQIIITLTK